MSFLKQFPSRDILLGSWQPDTSEPPLKVNNHIHSPYSFSAFSSIAEAVQLAQSEDVKILGINDFYVADAYGEFIDECLRRRVFPLLNIELIGISREDQETGIRINDPNNPGRIYVSGKGLAYPFKLSPERKRKLDRVLEESNRQVAAMIDLVNKWLEFQQTGISLSVKKVMEEHAKNLLR
jgi:hypothetical protein